MKEKKPFVANKNHYYFFFGLFLFLLSLILTLNIGLPARVLSTPFTYAFGSLAYLFYAFLDILALRLMFVRKFFKFRVNIYIIASIVLGIAGVMFFTHFVTINSFSGQYLALEANSEKGTINLFETYDGVLNGVSGGFYSYNAEAPFLSLFSYPFAGGIIGYILVGACNSLFGVNNGGFIMAIIVCGFAILLYFFPLILRLIAQSKQKDDKASKEEKEPITETAPQKETPQRARNIDPVRGASQIDVDNYQSEISGSPSGVSTMSEPTFIDQDSGSANFSISDNGMFEVARFRTDNGVHTEQAPQINEFKEKPIEEEFGLPEETAVPEQLELDFNAEPEFNEELVKAQPVFEEPVIANAQPQQISQPMVEDKPKPKERVQWIQPSSDVLNTYETAEQLEMNQRVADERKELINATFADFGVGASVEDYTIGPSITRFNVRYNHNVSVRSVSNLVQDIQIRLSGVSARFENIVEGQTTSGLEIPNASVTTVSFKDVYEALPDVKKHPLAVAFGKNIKGDVVYADFDEFPHMLVAGTTGSGKSIFTNSIIVSLIMRNSPDDLKLVLVDPKKVEMMRYKDMPHLLCPIITDAEEAKLMMDKLCKEMEERYTLFADNGCSNIKEFNEDAPDLGLEKLPYIIIFVDEYADIVENCKEISTPIVMIAQKARACGIHLSIATQRPSTNVITGVIKANLPTHVALLMSNAVDSMTIIGEGGAEKLIGKGDMLVQCPLVSKAGGLIRLQGCFIHRQEINRVVGYLKEHYETNYDPQYLNLVQQAEQASQSDYNNSPEFKDTAANNEEERYQAIKEWVYTQEFMSISRIQRECSVGFNRAGRFFIRLQEEGVVGKETEGNKGCRVNADRFSGESVVTSDEQTSFRSDD